MLQEEGEEKETNDSVMKEWRVFATCVPQPRLRNPNIETELKNCVL
jgi:uracil-DNA glycosylase